MKFMCQRAYQVVHYEQENEFKSFFTANYVKIDIDINCTLPDILKTVN